MIHAVLIASVPITSSWSQLPMMPMSTRLNGRQSSILLLMLLAVTAAFGWVLWPLFGAILWGVLLSVIFAPVHQALLRRMPGRRNIASGATVLLIAVLVVVPLTMAAAALGHELSGLVRRIQSGEWDVRQSLFEFRSSLPQSAENLLIQFETQGAAAGKDWLSTALVQAGQYIASRVVSAGQVTAAFLLNVFVMMYLLFYLLRDGDTLLAYVQRAIPLSPEQQQVLLSTFATTVRGTLKGDIVVAVVQGLLGGLVFWLLGLATPVTWGAVMALLSLLPAFGTALVWAPAGIYLLLTGSVLKGVALLLLGALLISTIDNILRPVLVGKDVQMPSFIVLVSSLGGIAVFGVNGVVIGPLLAALFLAAWSMHFKAEETPERTRTPAPSA
jgi:predicted PurR-regulated permease PerM